MSRCLSMRSSSASRDDATTVQKAMCTIAPGAIRTRRRRAKTASSTVPTVFESGRPSITAIARSDAAAAAEEPSPVGFHLRLSHGAAIDDGEVRGPDFGLARRSPSPRRQNGADVGQIFGFDEQLGKGWMRDVGSLGRQHELGIGGDVDLPHAAAGVRDRDATDLGIVFRRDEHLHRRRERSVAARELGAILIESDIVVVGLDAARLKSGRPYVAAVGRLCRKT